jgi:hypothetical protein
VSTGTRTECRTALPSLQLHITIGSLAVIGLAVTRRDRRHDLHITSVLIIGTMEYQLRSCSLQLSMVDEAPNQIGMMPKLGRRLICQGMDHLRGWTL